MFAISKNGLFWMNGHAWISNIDKATLMSEEVAAEKLLEFQLKDRQNMLELAETEEEKANLRSRNKFAMVRV